MKDAINELIREAHETAKSKGWWDEGKQLIRIDGSQGPDEVLIKTKPRTFGDQIALMHSELSEALEAYRDGCPLDGLRLSESYKPEGVASEFADVLIRIFDTCGHYKIPLADALAAKLAYNKTRPYRHGGKAL